MGSSESQLLMEAGSVVRLSARHSLCKIIENSLIVLKSCKLETEGFDRPSMRVCRIALRSSLT